MDTGRFKTIQPEQLVRNERKRAESLEAAVAEQENAQMGKRKRVSASERSAARARLDARSNARSTEGARARRNSSASSRGNNAGSSRSRAASRADNQGEAAAKRRPSPLLVVLALALVAVIVVVVSFCSSAASINITVNGSPYSIRGAKTLQTAVKESGIPLNSGDFISLQGNILKRHEGHPYWATVNGEEVTDGNYPLHEGDAVTLKDGEDIVEDYQTVAEPVPHEASIVGLGSIHKLTPGEDGVKEIRTGNISGEVVEKQTVDPKDLIETRTDIGVGNDKVIVLTFDGGPSAFYTEGVLDVLKKNDAKATFFCVGMAAETSGGVELVKRMDEQGCQVCSHSYSDARVANGDFSALAPEEQGEEIRHGMQVLTDILGREPSRYIRAGQDEIPLSVLPNIVSYVDAEIGWTLDTGDWIYVTEDEIYDVLMSAKAGDIIRMHDGGDHQDATIAALERALPKLKEKGFSFITVDELMAYSAE